MNRYTLLPSPIFLEGKQILLYIDNMLLSLIIGERDIELYVSLLFLVLAHLNSGKFSVKHTLFAHS